MGCVHLASGAISCEDGNRCTIDACSAGACSHKPSAAKTACDDGDLCTVGDSCDGKGACKAAAATCGLSVTSGLVARYSAVQDATTSTAYLQAGQVQQAKQGPIAAGAGKLSLGNSLLGGQSMGGYLAEVRAYAHGLGLGLALRQRLPSPVLLASAATGVGASPTATGLGLFARGRMRP